MTVSRGGAATAPRLAALRVGCRPSPCLSLAVRPGSAPLALGRLPVLPAEVWVQRPRRPLGVAVLPESRLWGSPAGSTCLADSAGSRRVPLSPLFPLFRLSLRNVVQILMSAVSSGRREQAVHGTFRPGHKAAPPPEPRRVRLRAVAVAALAAAHGVPVQGALFTQCMAPSEVFSSELEVV